MKKKTNSYAAAGVDRESADHLVTKILGLSKKTLNRNVRSTIGGYASLYEINKKQWLAASTDGVGTKLKLAFETQNYSGIGIDLVAMSINDLLCVGARPLFFLDYFATGKLESSVAAKVLASIVAGCKESACALVGGETAEMPDLYAKGEFDLAGFAVGLVEPKRALPSKQIRAGDVLIGLPSSGVHSNGFTWIRRMLDQANLSPQERNRRAQELLAPTRIYVRSVLPLLEKNWVKGLAHITGSGFLNVPRISDQVSYEIELPEPGHRPAVYEWIDQVSGAEASELVQTFNMGMGMVLAVDPKNTIRCLSLLRKSGEKEARVVGQVIPKKKRSQVILKSRHYSGQILNYS